MKLLSYLDSGAVQPGLYVDGAVYGLSSLCNSIRDMLDQHGSSLGFIEKAYAMGICR